MRFDWQKFCTEYRIPFVTRGHNVGRGNVAIRCPYCGEADPSEHLGLSLDVKNPAWGCLRNPQHRGRDPRRLVQTLLHCGYQQALSIVQSYNTAVPDDFDAMVENNPPFVRPQKPAEELFFPKAFKPLANAQSKYAEQFLNYVAGNRGFGQDVIKVCEQYQLHYALTGDQAWRLVIPIYDGEGVLRNWTGRAIHNSASLRYKNASDSGKGLLFNEALVRSLPFRIRTLFVVEGPFDCIKMDFYAHASHCACVAILGTSITEEQLARLALLDISDKICILMDPEAFNISALIESSLSGVSRVPVFVGWFPNNVEDPGAMTKKQVELLCDKNNTRAEKALV